MNKTQSLPTPRLELRWTKIDPTNCICKYVLVITPPNSGDCRSNSPNGYGVFNVEYELDETKVHGGDIDNHLKATGEVDTPFRDGAHIQWDGKTLNLPGFATYKGYASAVFTQGRVGKAFRYKK